MRTEIEKREEAIVEQTNVVESECPPETSNIEVNEEEPPHEKVTINTVNVYHIHNQMLKSLFTNTLL